MKYTENNIIKAEIKYASQAKKDNYNNLALDIKMA